MNGYRLIIFFIVISLVPVGASAQLYRYIDENGVERFSNEPPPPGVKIISEEKEIQYNQAADEALQKRNRQEAAATKSPPATPTPSTPQRTTVDRNVTVETDSGHTEKGYSRRKHRRKKEIRKEKAEARKAAEAIEGKKP